MNQAVLADWHFGLTSFVAIFTVLNPIHAIPLYLAMAPDPTRPQRLHVARVAAATALIAMLLALFVGDDILAFFGITLPAFRAGSGIILGTTALSMVSGQVSSAKAMPEETAEAAHWTSIAVVPLGTPILAGGGVLSTVILLAQEAASWDRTAALVVAVVVNAAVAMLCLRLSRRIKDMLGTTGINIVTRLMGLVLMALAVEFVATGARELLFPPAAAPGLAAAFGALPDMSSLIGA